MARLRWQSLQRLASLRPSFGPTQSGDGLRSRGPTEEPVAQVVHFGDGRLCVLQVDILVVEVQVENVLALRAIRLREAVAEGEPPALGRSLGLLPERRQVA